MHENWRWRQHEIQHKLGGSVASEDVNANDSQRQRLKRFAFRRPLGLLFLIILVVLHWHSARHSTLSNIGNLDSLSNQTSRVNEAANVAIKVASEARRRPGIGKVTVMPEEDTLLMSNAILQGHQRHADLHGYQMFVLRDTLLHPKWSKSAYMLSILLDELRKPKSQRLEWLFWFNSDVVLLNRQIPLELFLPPKPQFRFINLIMTKDSNGMNIGGFFVRVSDWAAQFFADVVAMPTYRPDIRLKYHEQSAMEFLAADDLYKNNTVFVPQRWFNAYRGPRDEQERLREDIQIPENTVRHGDLQLHFVGKTAKTHVPYWIQVAEDHSWELPPEQTEYGKEIEEFWKSEAAQELG